MNAWETINVFDFIEKYKPNNMANTWDGLKQGIGYGIQGRAIHLPSSVWSWPAVCMFIATSGDRRVSGRPIRRCDSNRSRKNGRKLRSVKIEACWYAHSAQLSIQYAQTCKQCLTFHTGQVFELPPGTLKRRILTGHRRDRYTESTLTSTATRARGSERSGFARGTLVNDIYWSVV